MKVAASGAVKLRVYAAGEVPAYVRTRTQLKEDQLKPAAGQDPAALLRMYRRSHGWGSLSSTARHQGSADAAVVGSAGGEYDGPLHLSQMPRGR